MSHHLQLASKAAELREKEKSQAIADVKAIHGLDVDQLQRRIRQLQEECDRCKVIKDEQQRQQHLERQQKQQQLPQSQPVVVSDPWVNNNKDPQLGSNVPTGKKKKRGTSKVGDNPPSQTGPLLLHLRSNRNVRAAVQSRDPMLETLWHDKASSHALDGASETTHESEDSWTEQDTDALLASSDDDSDQFDSAASLATDDNQDDSTTTAYIAYSTSKPKQPERALHRSARQHRTALQVPTYTHNVVKYTDSFDDVFDGESDNTSNLIGADFGLNYDEADDADWSALSQELNDSVLDTSVSD